MPKKLQILAVFKYAENTLMPVHCCRNYISVDSVPHAPDGILVVSMGLLSDCNLFNLLKHSDGIYMDSFGNEIKEGGSVCFVKNGTYYFMWESTSISEHFVPTAEMQWGRIDTDGEDHPVALYLVEHNSTKNLDLCIDEIIRPVVESVSDKRVLVAMWNPELRSFRYEFHNKENLVFCADVE